MLMYTYIIVFSLFTCHVVNNNDIMIINYKANYIQKHYVDYQNVNSSKRYLNLHDYSLCNVCTCICTCNVTFK